MNRREAVKNFTILGSIIAFSACEKKTKRATKERNSNSINLKKNKTTDIFNFNQDLIIPNIETYELKNKIKNFNFKIQNGVKNFIGKEVATYGVNADYLGSTLRVKTKDLISLKVENKLNVSTTCHWHGWHVNGENDGSMHQSIEPNGIWNPSFKVQNHAGTYFYHSHVHNKTAEQVYKGIAGMIIVDDDISESLDIPSEYGVDDIPLIVQDKFFTKDGDMPYIRGDRITMMGHMGNAYLVNGVYKPKMKALKTILRFRILNSSNARTIFLGFSDKREFYQITTDAGFMEKSLPLTLLKIAPAERMEILVDISNSKSELFLNAYENYDFVSIMKIDTSKAKKSNHKIPLLITKIDWINPKEAIKTRDMTLSMRHGSLTINNKRFLGSRIDEKIKLNSTEIWNIKTVSGPMDHPFHIHGTSFQILSRDGNPPLPTDKGWKDTVLVRSGEMVQVIMRFNYKADKNNPYMYHCHILEHEDAGMMGQFSVT
jgi:FtsP/CotA-like multicopper oxidase with cupredoxin domain